MSLTRLQATRYVTPLREGGSLPAVLEADDGALYVTKFRGAGQGAKALVAEVIAGELARAVGLNVPALVAISLDESLARTERDEEIRDLLMASLGTNIGLSLLTSALAFDPASTVELDAVVASMVVAIDAYAMNVDRSPRNTNLLWWSDDLWLIDHGAALLWHHGWRGDLAGADRPFAMSAQHVLLPWASALPAAGERLVAALSDEVLASIVGKVPDELWPDDEASRWRERYFDYLRARRAATDTFIEEAQRARGV